MHPSRFFEAGPARAKVTAQVALGGFYVVQDYVQERDGKAIFSAHGLFTYDREDRLYKLFWHDALGYVPPGPASGTWKEATLTVLRASLRGATRHVFTFLDADTYTLKLQFSSDHEGWADLMTGTYRRK